MADFCKQCAEELWGREGTTGDFDGITTAEDTAAGFVSSVVLCEGCGPIQVDHTGNCVSDCAKEHAPTPALISKKATV